MNVGTRRVLAAIAVAGCLCGGAGAALASSASRGRTHHRTTAERRADKRASASAAAAASFAALSSQPTTADTLPATVASMIAPVAAQLAILPDQSRFLASTGSLREWLVPGPANLCLVVSTSRGTSAICDDSASAAQHGMFGSNDGNFVGVFPNHVASVSASVANSVAVVLRPGANGAVAAPLNGALTGVTLTDATGSVISNVRLRRAHHR
jgi:hypothetical protein